MPFTLGMYGLIISSFFAFGPWTFRVIQALPTTWTYTNKKGNPKTLMNVMDQCVKIFVWFLSFFFIFFIFFSIFAHKAKQHHSASALKRQLINYGRQVISTGLKATTTGMFVIGFCICFVIALILFLIYTIVYYRDVIYGYDEIQATLKNSTAPDGDSTTQLKNVFILVGFLFSLIVLNCLGFLVYSIRLLLFLTSPT